MKLFAHCRQFTGAGYHYRGYVRDRESGTVVEACPHIHKSTRRSITRGGNGPSGEQLAMRCAERMLRRMLRELRGQSEG